MPFTKETHKVKQTSQKTGYRGDVPGCYVGQVWDKRINMVMVCFTTPNQYKNPS